MKEAVDNALDACEEAGILPFVEVGIERVTGRTKAAAAADAPPADGAPLPLFEGKPAEPAKPVADEDDDDAGPRKRGVAAPPERFVVSVEDNGPGIVKEQVAKIFGKLLYGSKFHRLRQSRGQQGIGISAAGMYSQLTTGKAVRIWTRTAKKKPAHFIEMHMDLRKNAPEVTRDETVEWEREHATGTKVSIELEAPGMDIVGFEHEANSAEQKDAVSKAKDALGDPLSLFKLPAAASCKVVEAKTEVETEGDHDHDHGDKDDKHAEHDHDGHDHDDHAGHTAFHVTYAIDCATPANLTSITFDYFKAFAGAKALHVSVVSDKAQNKFEVTREKPVLDLAGAI